MSEEATKTLLTDEPAVEEKDTTTEDAADAEGKTEANATPDDKTDDGPDDAPDESKDNESEGPPEKYDLGLSEDAKIPGALVGEFEELARKHGFTNDQAKEFATLMPRAQELSLNEFRETVQGWQDTARKQFRDDAIARGGRFVREFGDDGLLEVLDQTGLGNHPAVIGALDRAMRAMGEDNTPGRESGKQPNNSEDARLRKRFPSMYKDKP